VTNDRVLRFDQALTPEGWQRDVAVRIGADGIIRAVTADATDGERIAGAALPGVANVHSHAFQRAMAGLTEIAGNSDDDFWSWRELMYRFLARISPEDAEAIAAFAYMEMLEGGFTTVTEFHYLHHQPDGTAYDDPAEMSHRHAAAAGDTGIGLTLLPVLYAHADFGGKPPSAGQRRFITNPDGFARLVESAARSVAPGRLGLAPHSFRAVTPEELRLVDGMLPDGPRHIHVSEQTKEVRDCFAAHGVTPIRLLADTVDLSPDWCLIHCTHSTPEDLTTIAYAGAVAGLCPVTEANLGDGVFPAAEFLAKGGRLGVGTDSNILIGLAEELRQLEYSQRLQRRARNVLAPRGGSTGLDLFTRALAGGAQAAGLPAYGLRAGAQADIVVFDATRPDWAAADEGRLIDIWIFATGRHAIREVFAAGRPVVTEGRHRDRDRIERAYRAALKRISAL
jgi:formiminoglutamate deiminase